MMQDQMMQILQALHQKNNNDGSMIPTPQQAPVSPILQNNTSQGNQPNQPSMLGFLGGFGDTKNSNGGIDPSWITQMNQSIMKQTGQGNGEQPFPWQQQPMGQQMGQGASNGVGNMLKILSSFL